MALDRFTLNETDVARRMASGELVGPHRFLNVTFFKVRITGTGAAYRTALGEYVWRNPELYLNDEFLSRCYGLPVILQHPETSALTTAGFKDRVIGMIVLPFIEEDEVWGIAKIYVQPAARYMERHQLSTSPAVLFFRPERDNERIKLSDGKHLLIEGEPQLLDHLAICVAGVWDKGMPPDGIEINQSAEARADSEGERAMADTTAEDKKVESEEMKNEKERDEGARTDATLDKVLAGIDSMRKDNEEHRAKMDARLDALEKRPDAESGEKKAEAEKEEGQAEKLEELSEEEKSEAEDLKREAAEAEKRGDAARHPLMRKDAETTTEHSDRIHELACAKDAAHFCRRDGESRRTHSGRVDSMCERLGDSKKDAEEKEKETKEEREEEEAMCGDARRDKARADGEKVVAELGSKLAATQRELAELRSRHADRSDADYEAMARAEAIADEAYSALGERRPRVSSGEPPDAYRIRAASGLQQHSEMWKETDLRMIQKTDPKAFERIEGLIYADALKAADTPNLPAGQLREITRDLGGVKVIEFKGDASWMHSFSQPPRLMKTATGARGGDWR